MTKTTPRDQPPTAIERDTNSLQRHQGIPSTPQGKWAKGPPTAVTPTDTMGKHGFPIRTFSENVSQTANALCTPEDLSRLYAST